MWLEPKHTRKWRPDALESRIYAIAEAEAHANSLTDGEAAAEALEAVYRVMGWLQGSRSYKDVVEMIKDEFGVETSPAALSGFWRRFCSPYLAETQRRHARLATELANTVTEEEEVQIESQFWKAVRESAFSAMHSPGGNAAEVVRLGKLLISRSSNLVDERKVALLEEKAAFADEVRKKASERPEGGLTAEDMAEIERRLKLM